MKKKTEKMVIQESSMAITKTQLIKDFQKLGICFGDTVLVHSSLSKFGWIIGASKTVIDALIEVVSSEGNIIMPTQTSYNSDPQFWQHPPVPSEWWDVIRNETPIFDPKTSPTRGMGKIAELFRTYPNVLRSQHPQNSFAAWGKDAHFIVDNHVLVPCFGDDSPLAKNYQLGGKILLLGVDHDSNTTLHYAEIKANMPNYPIENQSLAMMKNGVRIWASFEDYIYDDGDFLEVGHAFENKTGYFPYKIGNASVKLFKAKDIVDYASEWFRSHRNYRE